MVLRAVDRFSQQCIPSREQEPGRFSIALPQVARNLNKVAIPAILFYAACSVPGAEAGFSGFMAGYSGTTIVGGTLLAVGTVTSAPLSVTMIVVGGIALKAAPYVGAVTGVLF